MAVVEIFCNASLLLVWEDAICNMEKGDGKFAHVVFSLGKERTRAWKALRVDIAGSEEGILQLDDEVTPVSLILASPDTNPMSGRPHAAHVGSRVLCLRLRQIRVLQFWQSAELGFCGFASEREQV